MSGVELTSAVMTGTRDMTLLGINTAAQAVGFLSTGTRLESFDPTDWRVLQGGIKAKQSELAVSNVSRTSHDCLLRFAEAPSTVDPDELLIALRVAERDLMRYQQELLAAAAGVTRPVPAFEDPRLDQLFKSRRQEFDCNHVGVLPTAYLVGLDDIRTGFAPIVEDQRGTEILWISDPSELGELRDVVAPHWMLGSIGMILYRNVRAQVVGAIQITGAARNDWNDIRAGAPMALGGVMCMGVPLDVALGTVVDKANDMIKWEVINWLLGLDVQLGPAKSILVPGGNKWAALPIHAIVMRFVGSYIGGNDQGTYADEAALLSTMAPSNFAGNRYANPKYRGLFPSLFTAEGVNEWLLLTLKEHVNDLRAPVAMQGYGGVGAALVSLAIRQGLRVSAIMDADVGALKRAAHDINKAGLRGVPLLFDVVGAREQCGDDENRLKAVVDEARRADFVVVGQGGLVGCLEELRMRDQVPVVVSPNAGAHAVGWEALDFAKTHGVAAFVGGANNVFTHDGLASDAVRKGIFVPWGPMINPMGALVVLANALNLTPEQIERAKLRLRELFYRSLGAHRGGVSPLADGKEMVAQTWNPKLGNGRAIGPRYGRPKQEP